MYFFFHVMYSATGPTHEKLAQFCVFFEINLQIQMFVHSKVFQRRNMIRKKMR